MSDSKQKREGKNSLSQKITRLLCWSLLDSRPINTIIAVDFLFSAREIYNQKYIIFYVKTQYNQRVDCFCFSDRIGKILLRIIKYQTIPNLILVRFALALTQT